MLWKYCNLTCTICVYVYFQIIVHVMGNELLQRMWLSGRVFTRSLSSFTILWKSQQHLEGFICNGDYITSVEALSWHYLWKCLIFLCTLLYYFYLTSFRNKMRLRLWNNPYTGLVLTDRPMVMPGSSVVDRGNLRWPHEPPMSSTKKLTRIDHII